MLPIVFSYVGATDTRERSPLVVSAVRSRLALAGGQRPPPRVGPLMRPGTHADGNSGLGDTDTLVAEADAPGNEFIAPAGQIPATLALKVGVVNGLDDVGGLTQVGQQAVQFLRGHALVLLSMLRRCRTDRDGQQGWVASV